MVALCGRRRREREKIALHQRFSDVCKLHPVYAGVYELKKISTTGTIAMLNIENKVVVITGASSGIGEATAILLANHGAKVVLGARRADKLERIVAEICSSEGTAESKAVDFTPHERP
jgi:NADPH:quinone reductase-like Zn-dependent oxidoreductase